MDLPTHTNDDNEANVDDTTNELYNTSRKVYMHITKRPCVNPSDAICCC